VLHLVALPRLFAKKKQGWTLVVCSAILIGVAFIVCLNIFALVMFEVVAVYFRLQIRECYE
jgi:hypothetical protein